jgi:oligopeptide transport system substrate-binding protein
MRNEEWGSYLNSQRQMNFGICRRSWVGDYLDANTYLDMFVTDGENNRSGWSNLEYDQLVADAAAELDDEKRLRLLESAERILMEELPIIPIYYYVSRNLVRPYVRGFYNTAVDLHPLGAIYVDRDARGRNEYISSE